MITLRMRRMRLTMNRATAIEGAKKPVVRIVADVTRQVFNQASVNCPVRTGNLRAHHRMTTTTTATRVRGQVYNDAKYAAAVHNGTRRHTIRTRRRKALRFVADGGTIYVRRVTHPGTTARPWLARAAQQVALTNNLRWTPE